MSVFYSLWLDIALVFGIIYFGTISLQPFTGHWLVKGLSTFLLGIFVYFYLPYPHAIWAMAAFVFSSFGDVFLARGNKYFVHGLLSFLSAHVLYILLFVSNLDTAGNAMVFRGIGSIVLLGCGFGAFRYLVPSLGKLKIPVLFYMAVLSFMAISSLWTRFSSPLVVIGALLFVCSDFTLAVEKFKKPIWKSKYIIWATYYPAQVLLAVGLALSL